MVTGMESFREHFAGYEDCYTIIGGAACDILMHEQNISFRATRDVDMIVLIENRFDEFGRRFWNYIQQGGYRCGWCNDPDVHFFRFTEPKSNAYPMMIELFSRSTAYQLKVPDSIEIPLHIDDDVSSLSAILLNEEYYHFMMQGRRTVDGISVLDAAYLIPFKIRAWLDLSRRKSEGQHVNARDLKKHKNDVFRLLAIIPMNTRVLVTGEVESEVRQFIQAMELNPPDTTQLQPSVPADTAITLLRQIYL